MTNRTWSAITALSVAVLLSACILLPGKFGSELAVRRDGTFSFSYKGEIQAARLSAPDTAPAPEFTPGPCFDNASGEVPCSREELARQKGEWDETEKARAVDRERQAELAKAMTGGFDLHDPKDAQEFAKRLMRQAGWKSVIPRGPGKFDVEFAISGRLDHDFTFPTVEKMPGISPFVTVMRRSDGTVRIEAPAFSTGGGAPLTAMLQGMSAMPGSGTASDRMVPAEGVFAVITDAEILANNTDEGPHPDAGGQRLEWRTSAKTPAAPAALLRVR